MPSGQEDEMFLMIQSTSALGDEISLVGDVGLEMGWKEERSSVSTGRISTAVLRDLVPGGFEGRDRSRDKDEGGSAGTRGSSGRDGRRLFTEPRGGLEFDLGLGLSWLSESNHRTGSCNGVTNMTFHSRHRSRFGQSGY